MDAHIAGRYEAWWNGTLAQGPILKVFFLRPADGDEAVASVARLFRPDWWKYVQIQAARYGMSPAPVFLSSQPQGPAALREYWLDMERRLTLFEAVVGTVECFGDAFLHFFPDFGSAVMASVFGEEPHYLPRAILNEGQPSETLEELEGRVAFLPDSIWWRRTLDFIRLALGRFDGRVVVGYPNLGGALDILASLRGTQNLLMDLVLNPAMVQRLEERIAGAWQMAFEELSRVFREAGQWITTSWIGVCGRGTTFPIQSDLSAMVSPAMFRQFVAPTLRVWAARIDRCIYHWDSPGQLAHLDALLEIEEIRAIQWVAGEGNPPDDDECWLPYYRRIAEAGKGVFISDVRPERVGWLLDRLPAERLAMNVLCDDMGHIREILDRYYRG